MTLRTARASLSFLVLFLPISVLEPVSLGQETPTIKVTSKVVTLPVTVRDKRGQILQDLTAEDFALQEDGRPQTIKYFEQQVDMPLVLGLLVDTSLSQKNVLDAEKVASGIFLDDMMKPDRDNAFLIHFDFEVEMLQDLTNSTEDMRKGLVTLEMPDYSPGGRARRASGGTLLYDAVFLASGEVMQKKEGRKALILLTDGVDFGSKETIAIAIEAAQRADTVVYGILFADDHPLRALAGGFGGGGHGRHGGGGWPGGGRYPLGTPDGKKVLERMSKETGGRMYEVSKNQTIEQIYKKIGEELRTQYNLGYIPDKASTPGYHKISLTAKRKDAKVQTRDGYYATQ